MKKQLMTAVCACILHATLNAQVAVNNSNTPAHASAMFDVSSADKGMLIPRMTTAQRNAIPAPATGLLVFDTQTATFWYFAGVWREISLSNGGGLTLPYAGSLSSVAPIFSIQNTSAGLNGPSILGRHLNGSGVTGLIASIWGDHTTNTGVGGTSNSGYGVYGYSESNHGIHGVAKINTKAGVSGYNLANGPAVFGLTETSGIGVFGQSTSANGVAGWFRSESNTNSVNTLNVQQFGVGRAAEIFATNVNNITEALKATGGAYSKAAIMGVLSSELESSASIHAENFYKGMGLYASSKLGIAGRFLNDDAGNNYPTIMATQKGLGTALHVSSMNTGAAGPAIDVITAGTGKGLRVESSKGIAAELQVSDLTSNANALKATHQGLGNAAVFNTTHTNTTATTVEIHQHGKGQGLLVNQSQASNNLPTVAISNYGVSNSLFVNAINVSNISAMTRFRMAGPGDFALYEDGAGASKIRFNNAGKGFFNGGTQVGGADMAEAFDVTGAPHDYEPGDVLMIAAGADRMVAKSDQAYSSRVAGVYATKPGVLMSEEMIDADLSSKVPMGVLGVIPTKVCGDGGAILRGDLLVSSSIPGVAMKADPDKLKPGQVIGKALENYAGDTVAKIRVLVNVQ